jgi:hypothetical protein
MANWTKKDMQNMLNVDMKNIWNIMVWIGVW